MRLRDGSGGVPFDIPATDDISCSGTFLMHALATVVVFFARLLGLLIEGDAGGDRSAKERRLPSAHRSLKSLVTSLGLVPLRPQRAPAYVRRVPAEWHQRFEGR